jgi:uncharacterized protein YyaL (SSP411 family)
MSNASGHPGRVPNRLAGETSPYLQQHAGNPVDWYPWGEEALAAARASGKPILLSIGYSACHWCHVMAHESFDDEATAALMNRLFVNVKVDREERPDLDKIYQIAHQMLTQRSGGWPLTMFLTHDDQRPFFGGTYFPREPRYGMPAFGELLRRVADYYRDHHNEIRSQNEALMQALGELQAPAPAGFVTIDEAPLTRARSELEASFDKRFGGFGAAPKFPHATTLDFLLRRWHASSGSDQPDLQALYMAALTLRRMGEGGIFDQLGGGFCRYSVDEYWMIPHFEKMLYDNGALLASYAQAAAATGDGFYAQIARDTAAWVMREMQDRAGGYYSSYDADSEGHEGKFYVWTPEQVRAQLSELQYALFAARYGLDRDANFEGRHWHLHCFKSVEQVAAEARIDATVAQAELALARARLLALRSQRIWPGRDDKILTSWNAIMIRGMAIAARCLGDDALESSAGRALEFLRANLWRNGRLLATFKDGRGHLNAYLDDYVLLADATMELLQVRWRSDELHFVRELMEVVLAHFADPEAGGFFFTSNDHERLIHRSKGFADDATPSGNGVAADVLLRLGHLLGEPRYLEAAENCLRAAWPAMQRHPQAHMSMLTALDEYLRPAETVILRGEPAEIALWQHELQRAWSPRRLSFAIPSPAPDLPAALADKEARGRAVAYRCIGSTCLPPIDSLAELLEGAIDAGVHARH